MTAHTKKSTGILRVGHSITRPNHNHCPSCNSLNIAQMMEESVKKGSVHLSMTYHCTDCGSVFDFHYEFMPPKPPMTFGQLERKQGRRAPVYEESLSKKTLSHIAHTIRNNIHNDSTCEGKRPILRDIFDEAVTHYDLNCGWETQNGMVRVLTDLLDRYARDSEGNPYHWHTMHDVLRHRARWLEAAGEMQ